ncbi:inhibin beta B chain-like [Neocloeon triangulifer]|uniref:inhibin beta B chain-like n=1 Tax=Neocloeon triangulifer TaxID=2078957 RepID=UPI00286F55B6|nr:inhibin beta B chain-like [Neocloeon triangulifer]
MASPTCWAVAVALAAVVWCPVQLRADQLCPTCSPPALGDASEFSSSAGVSAQQHPHLHHNHHQQQQLSDNFVRIEAIKQQILSKLGFRSKPNVSSSIPHEVLLETMRIVDDTAGQHRKQPPPLELEDDDDLGRASEIISFAEPGPRLNGQSLLEFSHSQENAGDLRIKSANLWVRMELRPGVLRGALSGAGPIQCHHHHHAPRHKNFSFYVFRANAVAASINATYLSGKDLELASSLDVSTDALGWLKFDITETVQEWYSVSAAAPDAARRRKLHLLVDCAGCCELVQPLLEGAARQRPPHHRPFLVVHTDPDVPKRMKRHALECSGQVKQCCKQRFYVNFTKIGWSDWIIKPSGYYANYCRGTCGLHRTPDTFLNYHTHVMEQYRTRYRLAGLQPCCSPVRFSPISLIYFDRDSNIVKQDLPKMSVEECGCP